MAIGDIIVGIDIGTSKVCTVVGEVNNFGQIEIICNTSYKCSGLKKGKIINEEDITLSIAKTIQDAEDETNLKINSAYVTILGKYVTIVQNTITKEVKDKYSGISVRDVQNAIMQVKDIDIPDGETLIDIVPDKITLDNGNVVTDPVGNLSSSFTISAQVILAQKDYVRQLSSIFKKAGLEIDGIVPVTLAERNLVLDKNELNDNIMILDIGAGNTDIGVFEGSSFIYTNSIPVGGDNITNDIALVLNISEEEADKLKRQYGLALKSYIDNDNDIILNTSKDVEKRYEELTKLISDPEVIARTSEWQKYMKEHAEISEVVEKYREYKKTEQTMNEAKEMMEDKDLKELAEAEYYEAKEKLPKIEEELKILLIPKDKDDDKNIICEIRAGAGGEEAALFAGTLFRMYSMYAERKHWKLEILNENETGLGGFKDRVGH